MHLPNLTALIFVLSCLVFAIGLDCTSKYSLMHSKSITITAINFVTDRCCYYYSIVPKNVTTVPCNPEGMDINWVCWIHTPHENNTYFSVQWYKAALGTVDMEQRELLSEMRGKYKFTTTRLPSTVNSSELSELFVHEFALTINNFSSSIDDGYYWCQIVVNDSCPLEPSPTGYVALGQFPVERCKFNILDFIEYDMPPICAELETLCDGETLTTELRRERVSSHINPTQAPQPHLIMSVNVILYGLIGGLLFIIVLLLLIIVACTVYNVRNCRMNRATGGMPSSVTIPYMYDT